MRNTVCVIMKKGATMEPPTMKCMEITVSMSMSVVTTYYVIMNNLPEERGGCSD